MTSYDVTKFSILEDLGVDSPWSHFSKVPKLFGRISGDNSPSQKRRRLEARNFGVILIFTPSKTYEKTSFTE